jgi:hypothetical protein
MVGQIILPTPINVIPGHKNYPWRCGEEALLDHNTNNASGDYNRVINLLYWANNTRIF